VVRRHCYRKAGLSVRRTLLGLFLCSLAWSSSVRGQSPGTPSGQPTSGIPAYDAPASPTVLTLDDAIELAGRSSPELQRARNSARLNSVSMRTLWIDQLLPQPSVTLFTTAFTGNLQRESFDDFGNPVANPQADWRYFSRTRHGLSLSWSFQGPSLLHAYRRQKLTNEARTVAREVVLTDVQFEVRRSYMNALEQRALLAAERELLDARRIDLDVAERLFSLTLRTQVDVLNAELAIEEQRLALRRQETAHARALLDLRAAVGSIDEAPFEVAEMDLPIFDPSFLDPEVLLSRAFETSTEMRRRDVDVRQVQLDVAEERAEWWPEVSAGFDVYRQSFADAGTGLFDPLLDRSIESQFFVQFTLPVLSGVVQQRFEQQKAGVDLANMREARRQDRIDLEANIRGRLLDLGDRWASLRLAERAHAIAQEALEVAREHYRLGTISFEDLRANFQRAAAARRQIITERYGFYDDFLALDEAVGGTLQELVPDQRREAAPDPSTTRGVSRES